MSSPPPLLQSPARWIWPFEILEQIGEGGMGVVYRARYVVNGRQVALKMLPGDVNDMTALARFERELDVLKTLRHPNIVRCFGGVCEDKRRFYAMELVEGGTLEDQLQRRGKLAWEQVIHYGLQICAALDCSHQKGVVHRDLKPSNFLLTPAGQVKLSDFGLASVMAARKITAAGKTAGTFLYMAPEQIRGQEVTPRTDLYALGCVLFELLAGQAPFIGDTPGATLHLHCYATAPRPTQFALDCPPTLEKLVLKLLEKAPEDRPESAAQVAKELRSVNQTITITAPREEQFLSGRTQGVDAAHVAQKKTAPIGASRSAGLNREWSIAIVVLLGVSLLGNISGLLGARSGGGWRDSWTEAARHPRPEVRIAAAETLGKMSARERSSVDDLTQLLVDQDEPVRLAAVNGLAIAGRVAQSAVPALIKLQKNDESESVRIAAGATIVAIREAPHPRRSTWLLGACLIVALAGAGVYFWRRSLLEK